MSQSLAAMDGVKDAGVTMTRGGAVRLNGVVESDEQKVNTATAVGELFGPTYNIDNKIVVEVPPIVPTMAPFASLSENGGELRITGLLPAEASKVINDSLQASGQSVISNITEDERVIAPAWGDQFAQSLSALDGIRDRKIIVSSSGDVTLHGIADSEEQQLAALENAASLFGESTTINSVIELAAPQIIPMDELQSLLDGIDMSAIRFRSNSAEPDVNSVAILEQVADALLQFPSVSVKIEGYTDSLGDYDYNLGLSADRAQSVSSFLTGRGVVSERLTAEGFGPSQPIASNNTAAGRAQNRRIEFKLTGE